MTNDQDPKSINFDALVNFCYDHYDELVKALDSGEEFSEANIVMEIVKEIRKQKERTQ